MLNARNISDLLSANVHPQLYPRMFLMTLHGKLVAYSTPSDVSKIRDQAAYISMVLRTRGRNSTSTTSSTTTPTPAEHTLKALTLETDSLHVIARLVQPNLILVLVGNTSPRSRPGSASPNPRAPSNPQDQPAQQQAAGTSQQLRRENASIHSAGSNNSNSRTPPLRITLELGADATYPPATTAKPLDDLLRRAEKDARALSNASPRDKDDETAETEPETDREQWSDSNGSNGNGNGNGKGKGNEDENENSSRNGKNRTAAAGVHAAGPSQLSQQIAASTDAAAREAAAAADRGQGAGVESREGQAGSRARQALAISRELLALQRRKLDAVADFVRDQLGGFRMPDDLQYGPR